MDEPFYRSVQFVVDKVAAEGESGESLETLSQVALGEAEASCYFCDVDAFAESFV